MAIKIGLLGGSFDPVHLAHIALATTALQSLDLAQVELIPAAQPWQRSPLASNGEQRLAMLNLAIRAHPGLRINPLEIQRGGKTYTIDTLEQLPKGPDYHWILGSDQLRNFCSWHRWRDIAERVRIAVAQRPGTPLDAPPALREHLDLLGRDLITLSFQPISISSTLIRRQIASGEPTDGLLDVAVAQYIEQNGLYRAPAA